MRIYITDGNNRASLAITRSLGKKGHQVFVGEKTANSMAGVSKYCFKSLQYPDPVLDQEGFVNEVTSQVSAYCIDTVIPVADITTFLIMENRNKLPDRCKLPFADHSVIDKAADKKSLVEIAKQLKVPVPETVAIELKDRFGPFPRDFPFPVVIKPSRSRVRTENGWISTSVTYANNEAELSKIIAAKKPQEFPILLQERIEGPGIGIFTCFNNGKPIAIFSHLRLREKPPSGGISVLRQSIPADPQAVEFATDLLKNLNWHGVAMVEFKLDSRDRIPKLIEINGRFWGSLQLAIDSGIDFPELLVKTLDETAIDPVLEYKIGVKSRWLLGDLDVLLMLLLKSRKTLNLPDDYPGKIRSFLQFFKLWGKDLHYEVLSTSDIRPFLYELKNWLKR